MDKYPKQLSSRVLTLNLRLPTVLAGMAVLFGGFVFVFILGLLLGSGYELEERLPGLEKVLPAKSPTPAPIVIAQDAEGGKEAQEQGKEDGKKKDEKESQASRQSADARKPAGGVIDQSDLEYRDNLKADKPGTKSRAALREEQKKKAEAEKKKEAAKKEERFRYVYQAASYKGQDYADKFVEQLKKDGIKARTQKSADKKTVWYRVMIDFTGGDTELEELKKKMRDKGVSQMVMLSKKPLR